MKKIIITTALLLLASCSSLNTKNPTNEELLNHVYRIENIDRKINLEIKYITTTKANNIVTTKAWIVENDVPFGVLNYSSSTEAESNKKVNISFQKINNKKPKRTN